MTSLVERLRTITLRELRVRAVQRLAILREMTSSRYRREMTDAEMLRELAPPRGEVGVTPDSETEREALCAVERIRSRLQQRPVIRSLDHADEIAEIMALRFPDERLAIVRKADRAVRRKFDVFGNPHVDFGCPTNWRLEPLAFKEAGLMHWSRIDYLNPSIAGDKKITWELNRHSHFVTLGQAYLMTGDEGYVGAFVEQAISWMDQNPRNQGINWSSSLELALRSIAWIWAINLFANSPSLPTLFLKRMIKLLICQAQHIENHISTYFSPNTHLTGEALGLFYVGAAFPEFRSAERWKQKGLEILIDEMPRQIRADGVYFEASSYYHRYSVDFYLFLFQLARERGITLGPDADLRLALMIDYLVWITRPDGTPTLVGDDDGGRLLTLGTRSSYDFRDSIAWGSVLLGESCWKHSADVNNPELLWLLGRSGLEQFDRLPAKTPNRVSRAFEASGQFIMRNGWEPGSEYAFFRCGPHGQLSGAHDHADQLSFELFADGTAWLVDPGTYTYTSGEADRNEFRLSKSHNTLTVDDRSSSLPFGPFSWGSRAEGTSDKMISNHRFAYVGGVQDGYCALQMPVQHRRSLVMIRRDESNAPGPGSYLLVTDDVDGDSEHSYRLVYHFGPGIEVASDEDGFTGIDRKQNLLHIGQFGTLPFRVGTKPGEASRGYSRKVPTTVGWVEAAGGGPQRFCSVVLPVPAGSSLRPLICRFAGSRDAISVVSDGVQDVFMFGATDLKIGNNWVRSCARITWLRLTGERIETAAIIHGSALAIDGAFQMNSSKSGYLLAEVGHRHLAIYSDDVSSLVVSPDTELLDITVNDSQETGIDTLRAAEMMAG